MPPVKLYLIFRFSFFHIQSKKIFCLILNYKMKFYFLFFIVILLLTRIDCFFKPSDFCRKTETKKSCMAFNCGTKYCVYYKSSCKNLISWGILMKKYAKEPTVYKNFLSNIKHCEKDNYKNQWSHRFSFG